ncbi:MAG: glycine cleavage system transcriptional repressor [Thermoleophilaceae bacterium]|nr:glycine cleavage system transcriptional repressor [Thermoleophilaceae bacterium]
MRHFALSAVGRDRPGIVAAVTEVLLSHALNIEDSQATILRGHFTMMLVVAASADADVDALRSGLDAVRDRLELEALTLSELAEVDPASEPAASHMVTVYGADHPGIVHAATAALAERGVDVTDLTTKLADEDGGAALYALMMEVALPAGGDEAELTGALERVGAEQGVEVSVRPLEPDAL